MPNKYNYYWTPLAKTDIDEVLSYISSNLNNPIAANNLLSKVETTINNICLFPYSYSDCSFFMIHDKNIRHARIDNYILFYEIDESKLSINILRFRYFAMDFSKIELV